MKVENTMSSFIYNKNKNKIKNENKYDKNDKLVYTNNYIYDEENNKFIKGQGKLYVLGTESDFEITYEYDEKGNMIKSHLKVTVMGKESKANTSEYVYNDNNLLIKEITNSQLFDVVSIYEYDDKSKLLKKCRYMNDTLVKKTIYEYDESKTKIIKDNTYDKDGKQKTYSIFDYDNDNLIKITTYNMDDSLKEYIIYEYSDMKN